MPILNTSISSDCDVVSSSCCATFSGSEDDEVNTVAGSRGQLDGAPQQRTFISQLDDDEFEEEKANMPKKRGPKKKRMTPARIAKLKQRRLKVSRRRR